MHFRSLHLDRAVLAVGLFISLLVSAQAQDEKKPEDNAKKQRFETITADGVRLVGDYYPSDKGKDAPTVMLLHAIGESRTKDVLNRKNFGQLPALLQKEGYTVLTFDFRGYGESTRVQEQFWNFNKLNGVAVNPARPPLNIDYKNYRTGYQYYTLCSDLNAAKDWLNNKNNGMECNANNVALIACEQTAPLALIWLLGEYRDQRRWKLGGRSQGDDITIMLTLSMAGAIGPNQIAPWIRDQIRIVNNTNMPISNILGDKDTAGMNVWNQVLLGVRNVADKKRFEEKGTGTISVKTGLVGHKLLGQEALNTEEKIVQFLKSFQQQRVWGIQPQAAGQTLFAIDRFQGLPK
jgi:hypothetical protein